MGEVRRDQFQDVPIPRRSILASRLNPQPAFGMIPTRLDLMLTMQGQAVFIPAGCAHQVCNLSDCIQIVTDFVSPRMPSFVRVTDKVDLADNAARCKQHIDASRAEIPSHASRDDTLQLSNILWFAWLDCEETNKRWQEAATDQQNFELARKARLEALQRGESTNLDSDSQRLAWKSGILTPAISSVRDDGLVEATRGGGSGESEITANDASHGHGVANTDTVVTERTNNRDDNIGSPSVKDALERLLNIVMESFEPVPPREARHSSASLNKPGRMRPL
jgi:hypothetical protein